MSDFTQPPLPPQAPAGTATPVPPSEPGPARRRGGLGIAALVLGIAGFVFAWIPFASYVAIGLAGIGVILGILALVLRGRRTGLGIAGLIISAVALIAAIMMTVLYAAIFFAAKTASDDITKTENKQVTVVYQVTGNSTDATVSYTSTSASGTSESTGVKLPFSKTVTEKQGLIPLYTLTATNGTTGTDVSCSITVDGKVVAHETSSGQFATVDCTATPSTN